MFESELSIKILNDFIEMRETRGSKCENRHEIDLTEFKGNRIYRLYFSGLQSGQCW